MNDDSRVGDARLRCPGDLAGGATSDRIGTRSDRRRVPRLDHDDDLAMRAGWRTLSEQQRREIQVFQLEAAQRVNEPKMRKMRLADPTWEPTDEDLHAIAAGMRERVLATHPDLDGPDGDPTLQASADQTVLLVVDRSDEDGVMPTKGQPGNNPLFVWDVPELHPVLPLIVGGERLSRAMAEADMNRHYADILYWPGPACGHLDSMAAKAIDRP